MAKLSTCKGCETKLTKEEKYTFSNKTYCKDCYDKLQADQQEYKNLITVICQYYKIDAPTGLILKQIKDYKEQYKYVYGGMGYCLWYIKEIERKEFDVKFGIALVKYYYEKAKEYFEQQSKISQSIALDKPIEKIRMIKIQSTINKKQKLLIDIDSLLQGGET